MVALHTVSLPIYSPNPALPHWGLSFFPGKKFFEIPLSFENLIISVFFSGERVLHGKREAQVQDGDRPGDAGENMYIF